MIQVQVMTDIILRVFKQTLTKADWINPNTKMAALDKTSRMRSYVAFEWWLKYHGDVNNFYDGVSKIIENLSQFSIENSYGIFERNTKIMQISLLHMYSCTRIRINTCAYTHTHV